MFDHLLGIMYSNRQFQSPTNHLVGGNIRSQRARMDVAICKYVGRYIYSEE